MIRMNKYGTRLTEKSRFEYFTRMFETEREVFLGIFFIGLRETGGEVSF